MELKRDKGREKGKEGNMREMLKNDSEMPKG